MYPTTRQVVSALLALACTTPSFASHPCTSPLILDLDGDGRIATTGLSRSVRFDINADGHMEDIGWTSEYHEEAFLWLDLNGNRMVDSGRELFGNATVLPDETLAKHGFEALAAWDSEALGGNKDNVISSKDRVWDRLRLWVDRNHDARAQREEVHTLPSRGVQALGLSYRKLNRLSGNSNLHALEGYFVMETSVLGETYERFGLMEDLIFAFHFEDHDHDHDTAGER